MLAQQQSLAAAQGRASEPRQAPRQMAAVAGAGVTALAEGFDPEDPSTWGNPGRNAPCPCGSGKKFKHCHGRLL